MRQLFNTINKITGCFVQILDQLIMPRRVSIIRFRVFKKRFLSLQHSLFRGFDIEESHVRSHSIRSNPRAKKRGRSFRLRADYVAS